MSVVICKICGNDIWEIKEWEGKAYCSNCNESRTYKTRNRRDGLTKSQKERLQAIKSYFEGKINDNLNRFDVMTEDYGCYIMVETTDNVLTMEGGMFLVGRRGKVECLNVYTLCKDKDDMARHYENMTKRG